VPSIQRAGALRLAYAATQIEAAKRAWRTPDVAAFRAWLEREAFRAAQRGGTVPRPLRPPEEWLLWRQATAEATRDIEWDASHRLAESLSRAARLMADWHIPRSVLRAHGTQEGEVLLGALERLEMRCRDMRAAGSHELAALLRNSMPPRPVRFAGFSEHTAALRTLLASWGERGGGEEGPVAAHVPGAAVHLACARDAGEELELAAEWCRFRLASDPTSRLLVVIPDLAQRRAATLRVLTQALGGHGAPEGSQGLAVEGGQPLSRFPLVRHALATLRLLAGALAFEAFSEWLRASFWRFASDADRALLDSWLRGVLQIEVSPLDLRAALGAAPDALRVAARALEEALGGAAHALGPLDEAASLAHWGQRFEQALHAAGWPGARALASVELETRSRFIELLAELPALGVHLGSLPAREAMRLLEALTARTAFAPASRDAAVTVTSALADPILRYDGIWVAGLHADAWPLPPAIDSFIPLAAQRRAGIPAATALGMLARSRDLLERWRHATPELVLSWPAFGDERAYLASPLLDEIPGAQPFSAGRRTPGPAQIIRSARRIETFEDRSGDPWPARLPLPRGARALEHQGRCPFRAYAELRLSCAPLEVPQPGIDPRERGRLLHRAVELVWRRLGDSSGLEAAHTNGALPRVIQTCVQQAAGECWPATREASGSASIATRAARHREQRRAVRLLLQLAALERGRPPFRVQALELRSRLELAGAALELRIDRIDALEDGSRIILDYKTGRPVAPDWLSGRIRDPQLPAYLLATGEDVVALATVHLADERIDYRGLVDRAGRLEHLTPLSEAQRRTAAQPEESLEWHAQVERWRAGLERLAGQFLLGAAAVDPVADACRLCHLQAFCRIGTPQGVPRTVTDAAVS
jgi:ATP-dependent helicase/nuclease subunit B